MKKYNIFLNILVLFVATLLCIQCGSSKKESMYELTSNTPFTISYATFQEWVAGLEVGGSGTNVVINFEAIETGVNFQKIFFQGQVEDARQPEVTRIAATFKNNVDRDIIMDSDPMKEAANTPSQAFPFKVLSNEAILQYVYEGKTCFAKVDSIIEEKAVSYPAAPPNGRN